MKYLASCCFVVAAATTSGSAQTHPYANAWSYVTTVVTGDGQFSATTVAGTGGTDTYFMAPIAVFVQSPGGRTSSACSYPGQATGQATAYLPLCGNAGCEDGNYFASSVNTTEQCGVTGAILALPVQTKNPTVTPFISWHGLEFSPPSAARENGASTLRARVWKSQKCSAPDVKVQFTPSPNPSEIRYQRDPGEKVRTTSFSGNSAVTAWKITTAGGNSHSGTITALITIIDAACGISGLQSGEAILAVSNP